MKTEDEHLESTWLKSVRAEGLRILDYWRSHVVLSDGSFHGEITHEGVAKSDSDSDSDRGLILAARILWTYSRAVTSGFAPTDEHRQLADRSYAFLRKNFWDPANLGFYWLLNSRQQPVNARKHIYGQAFAIYALAEYYAASGNEEALTMAQFTYTLIERNAVDMAYNGYFESFSRSWGPDDDLRLSSEDMNEAKSMNTHLHLLEAYTRLYQVWPQAQLRDRIENLLKVIKVHTWTVRRLTICCFLTPIGRLKVTLFPTGTTLKVPGSCLKPQKPSRIRPMWRSLRHLRFVW